MRVWITASSSAIGVAWTQKPSFNFTPKRHGDRNSVRLSPHCPEDQSKLGTEQPSVMQVCIECSPTGVAIRLLSLGRKRLPHETRTRKLPQTVFVISTEYIPKWEELNSHGEDLVSQAPNMEICKNQCSSHGCSPQEVRSPWSQPQKFSTKALKGKVKIRTKQVCTSRNFKVKK